MEDVRGLVGHILNESRVWESSNSEAARTPFEDLNDLDQSWYSTYNEYQALGKPVKYSHANIYQMKYYLVAKQVVDKKYGGDLSKAMKDSKGYESDIEEYAIDLYDNMYKNKTDQDIINDFYRDLNIKTVLKGKPFDDLVNKLNNDYYIYGD